MDEAVKKSYSTVQQVVDYSRIEKLGKSFGNARDTVTKQFKDATAVVQNKGISGSAKALRDRAFVVFDQTLDIGKRGTPPASTMAFSLQI